MLTYEEKMKLFQFLDAAYWRAMHTATETELWQFFDHAKQITETCKVLIEQFQDYAAARR